MTTGRQLKRISKQPITESKERQRHTRESKVRKTRSRTEIKTNEESLETAVKNVHVFVFCIANYRRGGKWSHYSGEWGWTGSNRTAQSVVWGVGKSNQNTFHSSPMIPNAAVQQSSRVCRHLQNILRWRCRYAVISFLRFSEAETRILNTIHPPPCHFFPPKQLLSRHRQAGWEDKAL